MQGMSLYHKRPADCKPYILTENDKRNLVIEGQGKCGVAVIRISGKNAKDVILGMTSCTSLPKPRHAIITPIFDPVDKLQLDRSLLLWFPGPKSFTGEDICELQVHGGPSVVSAVLKAISNVPHCRPAEPGEFTKRAFIGGKMDLTEVEGLADLIHAETEQQRRQALHQMEGSLGTLYSSWREILLKNVAHVEAYIDFSEEENIEDNLLEHTKRSLEELSQRIRTHLEDSRRGERLHNGVRTVIIGEPNVGKSSLLNYLVKRPAAIVTPIAGTTRDIVEINLDINGFPLVLADTAGLRDCANDEVEKEGMRRARVWAQTADLALLVLDAQKIDLSLTWDITIGNEKDRLNFGERSDLEILAIINKIDLLSNTKRETLLSLVGENAACISCTKESGTSKLLSLLGKRLRVLCGEPTRESPSLTQERHRLCLQKCLEALEDALGLFNDRDISVAAHNLRKALRQLGQVTGKITTDDVLDVIFRDFCIGK